MSLAKTLSIVKPAISSFDIVPILNHLCFKDGQVFAYNDSLAIQTKVDLDLNCAVPGELFLSVVSSLGSGQLKVEQGEAEVVVKSGRSRSKMALLPTEDFLFTMPDVEDGFKVTSDFLEGIKSCLISVGSDPTHPEQNGVALEVGKKTTLYSTDNKSISRYVLQKTIKTDLDGVVLLPKDFCEQLVAIGTGKESILLEVHDDYVIADFDEGKVVLYSKLMADLKLPSYSSIIDNFDTEDSGFSPAPSGLAEALSRSLLLLKKLTNKELKVSIKRRSMVMDASTDLGEVHEAVALSKEMPSTEFKTDAYMLHRACDICSEISIQDGVVLLRKGNFLHLVSNYQ